MRRYDARLRKLEAAMKVGQRPLNASVVFLDASPEEGGRIMWNGSEALRPYAGLPWTSLPAEWQTSPWPITFFIGVDPLMMLGILDASEHPPVVHARTAAEVEAAMTAEERATHARYGPH